ncbi:MULTISPECIES: hypothetical protein [unclassified Duganella]|uniref:hypothetical protein n=1 Tax=unclassified Duganella TaxID=2636909 RepID=UPI0011C1BAF6|nr:MULTISPECIES: hypothetical protein [unclassified Duganella]
MIQLFQVVQQLAHGVIAGVGKDNEVLALGPHPRRCLLLSRHGHTLLHAGDDGLHQRQQRHLFQIVHESIDTHFAAGSKTEEDVGQ